MSEQSQYHGGLSAVAQEVQKQGSIAGTLKEKYVAQGTLIAEAMDSLEQTMNKVKAVLEAQREIVGLQNTGRTAADNAREKFYENYPGHVTGRLQRIAKKLGTLAQEWEGTVEPTVAFNTNFKQSALAIGGTYNELLAAGNAAQTIPQTYGTIENLAVSTQQEINAQQGNT